MSLLWGPILLDGVLKDAFCSHYLSSQVNGG